MTKLFLYQPGHNSIRAGDTVHYHLKDSQVELEEGKEFQMHILFIYCFTISNALLFLFS